MLEKPTDKTITGTCLELITRHPGRRQRKTKSNGYPPLSLLFKAGKWLLAKELLELILSSILMATRTNSDQPEMPMLATKV